MPFVDPNFYKDQFGVEGKHVLLTFGLLSPNKGIEYVLRALPEVIREFPNLVYMVLGATHPNLVRDQGESYRLSLERLARDLGIRKNVIFYNRFVELHELTEFIAAADIYITPYLNAGADHLRHAGLRLRLRQGGHLHALLARGGVAGRRPRRAGAVCRFGRDRPGDLRPAPRRTAPPRHAQAGLHAGAGDDLEPRGASLHGIVSAGAAQSGSIGRSSRWRSPRSTSAPGNFPSWRLDHLLRMTDSTGMFQHASFALPNFAEGYCTDDNARALLLDRPVGGDRAGFAGNPAGGDDVRRLPQRRLRPATATLPQLPELRSPLARRQVGSDDCFGRAMWAMGACIGRSKRLSLPSWAVRSLRSRPARRRELTSPRAWASTLLGIARVLPAASSGDRLVDAGARRA